MFGFGKKNVEIKEQVLEEVTDEQLSQVTGGVGLTAASSLTLNAGAATLGVGLTASAAVDGTAGLTASATSSVQAPSVSAASTTTAAAQA